MERLGVDEDMPIEHNMITKAISGSQVRVEGYNFDLRKHLLEYRRRRQPAAQGDL